MKRNKILKKMGFKTYRIYLESDLWSKVRLKVFEKKGETCYLCRESHASTVHHNRYAMSDLNGGRLIGMFPLCSKCHQTIEFDQDGKKNSLPEVRRSFNMMRKTKGKQSHDPEYNNRHRKKHNPTPPDLRSRPNPPALDSLL